MLETTKVLKQTELLGQQFEVYGTPQEPLFKAKDVAVMLGLTNQREFIQRVDEDERCKLNLPPQGETWMLTEDGLYEVLMQSRKPIAKQFKKGVKAILKEIRTKGGYVATQVEGTPEMIMARALQVHKLPLKGINNNSEPHKKPSQPKTPKSRSKPPKWPLRMPSSRATRAA